MFARTMHVEVSEVSEEPTEDGDDVRFIQVWESGNCKDRGEKRVHLRRTGEGFEILSEEMLPSERLPVAKWAESEKPPIAFLVVGDPECPCSQLR